MKTILSLSLIALGVSCALANGVEDKPVGVPPQPITTTAGAVSGSISGANAGASSVSDSRAGAVSGASAEASSGDSSADADSSSGGNILSTSSVYKQQRQAPGLFAAVGNTTAGCEAAWNLGVSTPVGGLVGGKTKTRPDCLLLEASERELLRGNQTASIKLRCRISYYRETLGESCEALLNTQTQMEYATKTFVNESVKRAFEASQRK